MPASLASATSDQPAPINFSMTSGIDMAGEYMHQCIVVKPCIRVLVRHHGDVEHYGMEQRTIAQVLTEQIEAQGLTQVKLEELSGVPQPTISRLADGITGNPGIDICRALADALKLTVSQLIGEEPIAADLKTQHVHAMMQRLPEYKKDIVVKTVDTLIEHEREPHPGKTNGPGSAKAA